MRVVSQRVSNDAPMFYRLPRSSITGRGTLVLMIATSILGCLSCTRYSKLEAHEPGSAGESTDLLSAPIILVGHILSNQAVGRPFAPKWDPYIKIQEYRVKVAVESVLRGNIAEREVPIYYFGYFTNVSGPPHLGMAAETGGRWHLGNSIVFFLERERDALRTICDFRYFCAAQVLTGAHPNFRADPNEPLGCSIAQLLLSRGPNTTDLQMARAILDDRAYAFSEPCRSRRLRELEDDRSPLVREAAVCVGRASADRPCQMRVPPEDSAPR